MKSKKSRIQKSSKKVPKKKTRNYQYLLNGRSEIGPRYVLISPRVLQAINKSHKEQFVYNIRFPQLIKTKRGNKMEIKLENGQLFIVIDLHEPTPSAQRKTLAVSNTQGNVVTKCGVDGKPVEIC